ncbi:MAG: GAF domain-containing protein [Chloroflexi bacterium]|nr:GAF domain-containing protein [Chloroflexota bacterium]
MSLVLIASYVALVCYVSLVVVSLRQNLRNRTNLIFLVYLLTMTCWQVVFILVSLAHDSHSALLAYRLIIVSASIPLIVYYFFVQAFLMLPPHKWWNPVAWATFVTAIALTPTDLVVADVALAHPSPSGAAYLPHFGPLVAVISLAVYSVVGRTIYLLAREHRRSRSWLQKNRLRYLLSGITFVLIGTATSFVPALQIYPLDVLGNIINALLIAYVIFRYQLLDIRVVIRRGLAYVLLVGSLVSVYLLSFFALERAHQEVGGGIVLITVAGVAVLTLLVRPLRERAQLVLDRLIFREQYDAQQMLRRLSQSAATIIDLDELGKLLLGEVQTTMGIRSAYLFLRQGETGELYMAAPQDAPEHIRAIRFRPDHPLVERLTGQTTVLTRQAIEAGPQFRALWAQEREDLAHLEAELLIPLRVKNELIGIFVIGPKVSGEDYSTDDQTVLVTLANQTAVAIENAHLFAVARRVDELALLNRISSVVTSSLNVREVLETIVQAIPEVMRCQKAALFELNPQNNTLDLVAGWGLREEFIAHSQRLPVGESARALAASLNAPLVVGDIFTDPRFADFVALARTEGFRAFVDVPLRGKEGTLGVLTAYYSRPHDFAANEIELLTTFANQAAIAIENARLYGRTDESLRERVRELTALQRVGLQVASTLNLQEVLDRVVQAIVSLGYQAALLAQYEEETSSFTVRAYSIDPALVEAGESLAGMKVIEGKVALAQKENLGVQATLTGRVYTTHSLYDLFRPVVSAEICQIVQEMAGIKTMATIPLMIKNKPVGNILVATVRETITDDEIHSLQAFAHQAALAIENARLYQSEQERRKVADTLREVAGVLGSTLDLRDVLDRILEQLGKLVAYDSASIILLSGQTIRIAAGRGFPDLERALQVSFSLEEDALARHIVETRQPLFLPDAQKDGRFRGLGGTEYVRGWLGVPLLVKGEVIGLLTVDHRQPGAYSEEMARTALAFANQAALAIENARLYEEAQARVRELSALTRVGEAINRALSLEEILDIVLREAMTLVGREEGSIVLLDPRTNTMRIATQRGLPPEAVESFNTRPVYAHEGTFGVVIQTGEMLEIPDTGSDPRVLRQAGRIPPQLTNVPLRTKEGVIGVIALDAIPPDDRARGLLLALADLAAIAIQRARLFEAERTRAAQMALISKVSEKAASFLEADRLIQEVTHAIRESFHYYNVAFFLVDEEHRRLLLRAASGGYERFVAEGYQQSLDEGIIGYVARTGRSWLANDISKDPYYIPGFLPEVLTKSELCVPIKMGDKVIGALDVQSIRLNEFGQEDVVAMEVLADRIATAIQNARLYEQEQRRATQLRTVSEVAKDVTSLLELDILLYRVVDLLARTFGYHYANILLVDPGTQELVLRASAGQKGGAAPGIRLKVGERGITGWVAGSGQPLLVNDVDKEPRYYFVEEMKETRSELAVPIKLREEVIGVLDVQSAQLGAFGAGDLEILQTLADQVAIAIENARLYAAEHARAVESSLLLDIANAVNSTLDLTQVLKIIAHRTARVCDVTRCSIFLLNPEGEHIVPLMSQFASGKVDKDLWARFKPETYSQAIEEIPALVQVMRQRQALVLEGETLGLLPADWVVPFGIQSVLIVPLVRKDEVIGFMALDYVEPGRQFEAGKIALASTIASQVSVAIENARLYQQAVEERRKSDTIVAETFSGIIVVDLDLRILIFNPAAETITGYRGAEVVGRRLDEVFGESLTAPNSPLSQSMAAGERVPSKELVLRGTDANRDVLMGVTPLRDHTGNIFGYLLSFTDISRLKEVDRLKSNIISNVSHELRTPLATVKAYAELLLDHLDEGDLKMRAQFLQVIERETDRLTDIVNDLLNLSRLESGRFEPRRAPLDLSQVINEVVSLLHIQAQQRRITVQVDVDTDLPPIQADREMITIVVKNLLSNAIKFSHDGGLVNVSAYEKDGNVILSVQDHGVGIPPESMPHLFEKFYRAPIAAKLGIKGAGLGLALAREATEAHGGKIEVQSELGAGSRFTVILPKEGALQEAAMTEEGGQNG